MRAKTKIFHIECFRCSACTRQLIPGTYLYSQLRVRISLLISIGLNRNFFYKILTNFLLFTGDEFALRDGGALYCKEDHDVLEKSAQSNLNSSIEPNNNNNPMISNNNTSISNNHNTALSNNNHSSELGSMSGN